jgi:hypothetical protein
MSVGDGDGGDNGDNSGETGGSGGGSAAEDTPSLVSFACDSLNVLIRSLLLSGSVPSPTTLLLF